MILTVDVPGAMWMTSNRMPQYRAHKARMVRAIQDLTRAQLKAQRIHPIPTPVVVSWQIGYPKGVPIADPANTHPTTKPILDALVSAGIIDGDDSRHVLEESYRRGPDIERGIGMHRVVLTIEPLEWARDALQGPQDATGCGPGVSGPATDSVPATGHTAKGTTR